MLKREKRNKPKDKINNKLLTGANKVRLPYIHGNTLIIFNFKLSDEL